MKFCSDCAHPIRLQVPPDDNRERHCCEKCGAIHYFNPKVVVGTITVREGRVLMCKRAIQPRLGLWTLPAGFLENGETIAEGAARETLEETGAQVRVLGMHGLYSIPNIDQIYTFFTAEALSEPAQATPESSAVQWMREDQIPWKEIAFPVVTRALLSYFEGTDERPHMEDIRFDRARGKVDVKPSFL